MLKRVRGVIAPMNHLVEILREFHRARAASLRRALEVLIEGARRLVPRASASGVVLLRRAIEPAEKLGDARSFAHPDHVAHLAKAAITEAAPLLILTPESSLAQKEVFEQLQISSLAWVPLVGHLPAGPGRTGAVVPVPAGALILETDTSHPPFQKQELGELTLLLELAGEVLFASQDPRTNLDGRLPPAIFRRTLEHWIALARARNMPLSLALMAVEGLEDVNQRFGYEAGDRALEAAMRSLGGRLPQNAVAAHHGGAVMAVLLLRKTPEESYRSVEALAAGEAPKPPAEEEVPLRTVAAMVSLSALPESRANADDLVGAAEAALIRARAAQSTVLIWTEAMGYESGAHPFSDFIELDGAGYQRLLALWRLLDAMSRSAGLADVVFETLRALMRPFRADRASLWRPNEERIEALATLSRAHPTPIAPSDRDRDLVNAIAEDGDIATREVAGRTRSIAVACREGPKIAAALCLSAEGEEGALSITSHDVSFLRALTQQIARALRDVAALEESRRQRQRAEQRLQKQSIELRRLLRTRTGLLGTHEDIRRAMTTIERAARTTAPVLVTGETGTGKGAAARLIHQLSHRRGPWMVFDCGAVPSDKMEIELFGRIEEAHQGTLFIDEAGELPLQLQLRLLRVVQDAETDVRLISASNRDLRAMVQRGLFREDLYFRLASIEIAIPPLRARGEDVILLALYFLREFCAELGKEPPTISSDAQDALLSYAWPGNVRELQNRLRRAVTVAQGPEITPADLDLGPKAPPPRPVSSTSNPMPQPTPVMGVPLPAGQTSLNLDEALADWFWHVWLPVGDPAPQDALEAFLLRAALQHTNGSRRTAAEILGMHSDTLNAHLQKLSDPALSRSLRAHPAAQALMSEVARACASPGQTANNLMDRVLAVVLRELLVYCRGNKSEMARIMGCGRRTLLNQLARYHIVPQAKDSGEK